MDKVRRQSRKREFIYDYVVNSKSHPTAEEVYSAAKELIPALSLGTVYRNLRLLVEEGKIREFTTSGSAVSRYDGMTEEHEHVICTSCGKIIDIAPTLNREQYLAISDMLGGIITSHKLSYFGICKDCTQNS